MIVDFLLDILNDIISIRPVLVSTMCAGRAMRSHNHRAAYLKLRQDASTTSIIADAASLSLSWGLKRDLYMQKVTIT